MFELGSAGVEGKARIGSGTEQPRLAVDPFLGDSTADHDSSQQATSDQLVTRTDGHVEEQRSLGRWRRVDRKQRGRLLTR